jgi:predicted transcriptional regulator
MNIIDSRPDQLSRDVVTELAWRRKRALLNQTIVAEKLGMSQHNLSRIEVGQYETRLSTLAKYAEALGLKLKVTLEHME